MAKKQATKSTRGSSGGIIDPDDRGLTPAEQEQFLRALEAACEGDFSTRMRIRRKGLAGDISTTFNDLMKRRVSVTDELHRISRRVGQEGRLDERAAVRRVGGGWDEQIDALNTLIDRLVQPIGELSRVLTAVAAGDFSQRFPLEADGHRVRGQFLQIGKSVNSTVDQLASFADEVTRVAREVGTEGQLGGQARVRGALGIWRDLTDNVNSMARNLTDQVRNIAEVTTAVAQGDLSHKITVEARGEILELKTTINSMVDQLSAFADEVTRVAGEVGTQGQLGGQARVEGASGTWKALTENVNQLAANLTTQVRAIAEVSTAVTRGDLSQRIDVDASGEVAELKDTINQMIVNLSETTERNDAQDWLKTNVARIATMLQGQRDAAAVANQIMSEVVPLVEAHSGAFFLLQREGDDPDADVELRLIASYAHTGGRSLSHRFQLGEGLVGQAALERSPIMVTDAPPGYVVQSGLGESVPVNLLVMPLLFEDQLMGVIELASLRPFTPVARLLLDELVETLGIVLHTIEATMRTEQLLQQSQGLTQELQAQSEELQSQQEELQQTNEELEEKAELLEAQKRAIELTNAKIEKARHEVEERAEQLARASRYKSEFLANMSHELRTPLNSMLILSRLLADDGDELSDEQREFAETIHRSGNDLLDLINDILDLSKIEAGRMDVAPENIAVADVVEPVRQGLEQVAADKALNLEVELSGADIELYTDVRRLQQVLKNLLSNAIKFTEEGDVRLEVRTQLDAAEVPDGLQPGEIVAFRVTDTGVGINEDLREVIFEAFQQGDGSRVRRHGGTGLGLSISRELSAMLGGALTMDSEPGKGSTFTLYLPVTYVPREEQGAAPDVTEPVERLEPISLPNAPARPARLSSPPTEKPKIGRSVADDRDELRPDDPCLLAMVADEEEGSRLVGLAHRGGHHVVVALDRTAGFALAAGFRPSGILLWGASTADSLATLAYLMRRRETRHVPVCVAAVGDDAREALRTGAAFTFPPDADDRELEGIIARVMSLGLDTRRRVLVLEEHDSAGTATSRLFGPTPELEVVTVASADEARRILDGGDVDLIVLDVEVANGGPFDLLEEIRGVDELRTLPVVVHTGKSMTREDEARLTPYVDSIVLKTVASPARLVDEALLHLHRAPADLPEETVEMLDQLYAADEALRDKRVLVVDDDERNVFALRRALEAQGMLVDSAGTGEEALRMMEASSAPYDLVLMDIMMPDMDGHEATRHIREREEWGQLPIITLTAKAMREDREESLAAGASDFITKPVDTEQLLALLRVWLYR